MTLFRNLPPHLDCLSREDFNPPHISVSLTGFTLRLLFILNEGWKAKVKTPAYAAGAKVAVQCLMCFVCALVKERCICVIHVQHVAPCMLCTNPHLGHTASLSVYSYELAVCKKRASKADFGCHTRTHAHCFVSCRASTCITTAQTPLLASTGPIFVVFVRRTSFCIDLCCGSKTHGLLHLCATAYACAQIHMLSTTSHETENAVVHLVMCCMT